MKYKIKKIFYSFIVRLIYIYRSLKTINNFYLGEEIFFKGEPCRLINGAYSKVWKIMPITEENLARSHRVTFKADPKEFKRSYSVSRFWTAFKNNYKFWMGYWFKIDLGRRMHPENYSSN